MERGGAVSGARSLPRPPVSFIMAVYEKRYSEIVTVKGTMSQMFCHP